MNSILNTLGSENTDYIQQKINSSLKKLQTSVQKCPFADKSPYFPLLKSEKKWGVGWNQSFHPRRTLQAQSTMFIYFGN
jgi:hypothetical protein